MYTIRAAPEPCGVGSMDDFPVVCSPQLEIKHVSIETSHCKRCGGARWVCLRADLSERNPCACARFAAGKLRIKPGYYLTTINTTINTAINTTINTTINTIINTPVNTARLSSCAKASRAGRNSCCGELLAPRRDIGAGLRRHVLIGL